MNIEMIAPACLAELTALANRNCDLESGQFTPELLRQRLWESPFMLDETVLGAFEDGQLVGVTAGGLKEQQGFVRLFAIDRQFRRQGLASQMLTQIEETLRSKGATEMIALHASPGYFTPGLDPRYTEALCVLHRFGYERTSVVANMAVPLGRGSRDFASETGQAERHVERNGLSIRRAEASDRPEVLAWMHRHFPGGWEMETDLSFKNLDPIPIWLAVRDGAITGFALYGITLLNGGFGPTGVDESLRGMGVGRALMLRTLADMQGLGYTQCEIAWVGPVGFYANVCGARINRTFWQMHKGLT